jgi:hypothetical protein
MMIRMTIFLRQGDSPKMRVRLLRASSPARRALIDIVVDHI